MGEHGQAKADWYPDPHGGSGVRWWDGDRWTGDVRDEHPRAGWTPSGPATPPPSPVSPSPPDTGIVGRPRTVVTQLRPRQVGGPAYVVHDPGGFHLGTFVERPLTIGGHPGERAATLDLYDATGTEVLRLTRDPHLVGSTCAAAGWAPIVPWGYVVLRPDLTPVAWVRAPAMREVEMAKQPWLVHCLDAAAPIEIRSARITSGRKAPRPVTMGGAPVGQITLVSGSRQPDGYVLDLFQVPPESGLATTFAALVPLYDQIFRTVAPPVRAAVGTFDPSWGSSL